MSTFPRRRAIGAGALAAVLLLTGCANVPDFRDGMRLSNPFARAAPTRVAPSAGSATPVSPAPGSQPAPAASIAETACLAAGREAGFDVRGVVGTREVIGANGLPESRDVMLRVDRAGQSLEVRCSFAYQDAQARIMTL
jgi:hypothetical protein